MTLKHLSVLALLSAGVGCSDNGGGAMNNPFKKYTKQEQLTANAARSYKEIRRDKVIYVVSSPDAERRVNGGDEPAMIVAAIGYGPQGEKVVFEASKDGIETGLMKEFERRHADSAASAAARS